MNLVHISDLPNEEKQLADLFCQMKGKYFKTHMPFFNPMATHFSLVFQSDSTAGASYEHDYNEFKKEWATKHKENFSYAKEEFEGYKFRCHVSGEDFQNRTINLNLYTDCDDKAKIKTYLRHQWRNAFIELKITLLSPEEDESNRKLVERILNKM